jgi:predicted RNase H-like nuclease
MAVVGIDGCRRGWVGVVLGDGAAVRAVAGARLVEVIELADDPDVVAVDMPIGLSERGLRGADVAARDLLGRRRAAVFLTPVRQALSLADYSVANAVNREATGQGVSKQAWALAGKIAEVEAWRCATGRPVWEVHPEVAFLMLSGAPLAAGKKTWAGSAERRALLARAGIVLPEDLGAAGAMAAVDDVLDAAVVAWSARRIATGQGRCWPDPPETDHLGRPMAIWA